MKTKKTQPFSVRLFLLGGLFLSLGLTLSGCENADSTPSPVIPPVQKPDSFTLKKEVISPAVELSGTVEANKQVSINSAVGGRVSEILVETGDRVKKGQILARLSAHDNSAAIQYQNAISAYSKAQATVKNNVRQAEINLENAQRSQEKNLHTQEESYVNTFQLLITQAQSSQSRLQEAFYWADRIMIATEEAKKSPSDPAYHHLGSNQSIEKQSIRNEIIELYFKALNKKEISAPVFDKSPKSEQAIFDYAQDRLNAARSIRSILQRINTLIVKTSIHSQFSAQQRQQFKAESNQYLQIIDQIIVSLDNSIKGASLQKEGYNEALSGAENQVRNAEAALELVKASTQSELNNANSQVRIAKLAQNELTLRAPFNGIITKKNVEEGQLINLGTPILEIADRSTMKIKTDIADVWATDAQSSDLITQVRISGIRNKVYKGHIDKIDPAVDPKTRKIGIEIKLDEPDELIKIGMFARVTLQIPEMEAYFIPRKFMKSDENGPFVQLTDGTKKYVEKGFDSDSKIQINFIEIEDGLQLTEL